MIAVLALGDLVVIGLAAWRVARLLVMENGPADIAGRFRRLVRADDSEPNRAAVMVELFSCVLCLSFWTALVAFGIYQTGLAGRVVIDVLAVWGGASLVHLTADSS